MILRQDSLHAVFFRSTCNSDWVHELKLGLSHKTKEEEFCAYCSEFHSHVEGFTYK